MTSVVEMYRGFACPEGPVSLDGSRWLVTEMDTGAITQIGPGNDRTTLATTGRPNGLALDGAGATWIAESKHPGVLRLPPGASEAREVAISASDEPLLWPNDLCFGPDGTLYVTDSGARIEDWETDQRSLFDRELDGRIIAVDPLTGEARILDRGLQFANGIAMGPDNETLYVAETITGLIHTYPLSDISAATRRTFGTVLQRSPSSYPKIAGPDGMAFDEDGVLLVAVLTQGTLTVLSERGDVLEHIPLPDSFPTNLAFGGPQRSAILVTGCATGALYGLDWRCKGLELHRPAVDIGT